MEIRKVLFPVEFHEASLRLIWVAADIVRRFHAQLVILHVVAPESYSARDWKKGRPLASGDLLGELVRYAEQDLRESVQPAVEGLPLRCIVAQGDAASGIIEAARNESVDLIVMATRGNRGFYRHLIGSVTTKVMYETDCPVLTSAHLEKVDAHRELKLDRVLCGVTFSEHSLDVLKCAAQVAAEFQAKLTIAHVTPDVEMYGPGGNYIDRGWKQDLVRSAQELAGRLQQQVGIAAEVAIESGDPGAGLSRIAARTGADLLVVGCHNSGGHFGSNGYGIISQSLVPVLSV